jgi:cell division protein DivIC
MVVALSIQYARTLSLARQADRLETRREALIVENQALRGEIHRLRTDDQYIEQLAREQLGLLKPGEVELQIVSPPSGASAAPEAAPPGSPPAGGERAGGQQIGGRSETRSWLAHLWALVHAALVRFRR